MTGAESFRSSTSIARLRNARFFAEDLFRRSFAQDFPVPPATGGASPSIVGPGDAWHQYVAFYKWSPERFEPVGFCNWIRHENVYLEGGLCVKHDFYRRLPREHWRECKAAGGIAQMMMEQAATELNDCPAWFGYCGDKRASIVDARVGYETTDHAYLTVKWFAELSEPERHALIERVARIGPF